MALGDVDVKPFWRGPDLIWRKAIVINPILEMGMEK
jgi:hypothetical protein